MSDTLNDIHRFTTVVPACLRNRPQWVCWRYVERDGKATKCPLNPNDASKLTMADATDPATWSTFETAVDVWQRHKPIAGVGFVFTPDDPYCGIDLDNCIDTDSGQPKPWARELIEALASYTEVSPSRHGVKIFAQANKPGVRCRKTYHDGEIEIYDRSRFFTVTGRHLPSSPTDVNDADGALQKLYAHVFGNDDDLSTSRGSSPSSPTSFTPSSPPDDSPIVLTDEDILRLASSPRRGKGEKFKALWEGHWNNYFNSWSEADSSVVFTLAYYTKDSDQIDRLFRQSGLDRDKWDDTHGTTTYGQMTIDKALAKVTGQYKPRGKKRRRQRSASASSSSSSSSSPSSSSPEPIPGTIDPTTGRIILSTRRTQPTAQAFIDRFHRHADGPTLRHYAGMFLQWKNNCYVEVEDNAIRHHLLPWMHEAVRMVLDRQSNEWVPDDFPANPTTVNAALDSLRMRSHLAADTPTPSWLCDANNRPDPVELLPCLTHTLHLPTMRRYKPTPTLFSLAALDYDPQPQAGSPERWLTFLGQLFGDDGQSLNLLQEWFGYCLTGDTSQHKMLLMVGPKRSGKGTIARVLTRLIGASNVCGPTTSSLAGNFGLQPLLGKSLAIVSDARFSGENVQTVIERLLCVSGEDTLTIDRKHKTSVTMKLPTRFVFLTNELPRLNDASGALAGRFMILRLTESFYGREDKTLTAALIGELPGILNWAIEGWKRLRERGQFIQPDSVEETMQDMEDLSSPVGAFVRERCVVGYGHRIWVDDLYNAWRQWCESEGRSAVTTKQTFGRDLLAAFPGLTCRRNRRVARFYEGIALAEGNAQ